MSNPLSLEKALQNSSDAAKRIADHAEHCEECNPDFTKDRRGEIAHPCVIYRSLTEDWSEAVDQANLLVKKLLEDLGHASKTK